MKADSSSGQEDKFLQEKLKKGRKPGTIFFPRNSLQEALKIPKAIWNFNAGRPFPLGDLSDKVNYSPMSGSFRELVRSAERYGLTEGTWRQITTSTVSLSSLGESIVAPKTDDNVNESMRKALEKPDVFREFLYSVDGRVIPPEDVFKNTLIREHHLSREDAAACYKVLMKNIDELDISKEGAQGKKYLRLDRLGAFLEETQETEAEEAGVEAEARQERKLVTAQKESEPSSFKEEQMQSPKQIFVAHGKNKRPLEQLTKILTKYKIPHVVATDEPHRGRPIGVKVGEEMKRCTAGIFIFTADEESKDEDGNLIMKPSDNVVYELGAGSVLYTNKIIILREDGVNFATDFTELGRITFDKDKLDAKGLEIISELEALEIIKFSVT